MRAMKSTTSFVCVTSFHFKYLCGKNFSIFKFLSLLVLYLHHIRLKSISLCTHMINVCKIMLEIPWDLPDRSNSRTSA